MAGIGTVQDEAVACFIEENLDAVCDLLVARFREEFSESDSLQLGEAVLHNWTASEMERLICALRGVPFSVLSTAAYAGDAQAKVSPILLPMVTQLESWLFVSHALAPFLWRGFAEDVEAAQGALAALEAATIRIMQAILADFSEKRLVAGSLSGAWFAPASSSAGVANMALPLVKGMTLARDGLTARERDVARLVAQGKTNGEVAVTLGVAQSTVKNHLVRIFDKLNVNTRTELARVMMTVDSE